MIPFTNSMFRVKSVSDDRDIPFIPVKFPPPSRQQAICSLHKEIPLIRTISTQW